MSTNHVLSDILHEHREPVYLLFRSLIATGRRFLVGADVLHGYRAFCRTVPGAELEDTPVTGVVEHIQELVVDDPLLFLAVRERVAQWTYLEVHTYEMTSRTIDVADFLKAKERIAGDGAPEDDYVLEVDLSPFERGFPKISDPADVGHGVEFLNRHLSGLLARAPDVGRQQVFDFLRVHQVRGRPLMVNSLVADATDLRKALEEAVELLGAEPVVDDWQHHLGELGFEAGWGRTAARTRETMLLLTRVLDEPDAEGLAEFLARVPMIFSIVIVSPHGYFGQANVLGKPDTGGQVVYILDQVRALERAMRVSIRKQGLDVRPRIIVVTRLIPEAGDTTCDQRVEAIHGTRHAVILRVPFRTSGGEVVREWVPRFEVWPYLERFTLDAEKEVLAELGGRPDMVVGNYSDGNLVATLLTRRLGVTQCSIAHALEKAKYPNSDLHWQRMEADHHFSCQFTADLISMNTADFIITSTFQEIAGTECSVGQYESHQAFTLPGLYRVVSGIDCFDPKFNILSPGANPEVFFPWFDCPGGQDVLADSAAELVYGDADESSRGRLVSRERPLLMAMSRLDSIKNATGLLRWYTASEELQEEADLLIVGGTLDPERSRDPDERGQIEKTHEILDAHHLDGHVRWIEMQTDKNLVGSLYRFVANTRGAFVQPALFEAFGLTVVEAMTSGLPVFATRYGGPLEIVEHGVSGFHIDPLDGVGTAALMADFLRRSRENESVWTAVSKAAVARAQARYTWARYADEMLRLSRIYGFWRHISSLERAETRRYLEMFYGLMYRPLAGHISPRTVGPT